MHPSRLRRQGLGSNHLRVADDVQQRHNVGTSCQILEDLDLSLDLLLLDRLEDLDDALLVVDDVDTLENLAIFSAAYVRANDAAVSVCVVTTHGSRRFGSSNFAQGIA